MATSMISNLGSFKKTLAYHKRRIKETATQRVQRFTKDVLIDLAKNTPQWSGDLAASWQVVVGEGGYH